MPDRLTALKECLPELCQDAELIATIARAISNNIASQTNTGTITKTLCNKESAATSFESLLPYFGGNRYIVDEDGFYILDEDGGRLLY